MVLAPPSPPQRNPAAPQGARPGRVQIGANVAGTSRKNLGFNCWFVEHGLDSPVYQAVRASGSDVDRAARRDVASLYLDSQQGGLRAVSQIRDWGTDKIYQGENTGIFGCWQQGIASLAYATTVNTSLKSVDASAYNSSNKRVHSVEWPTSTGTRTVWCIGPNLYITTSVSNPAPKVPATADNITDNVTAMWVGINSSGNLALYIGTDSTTDDIKYTEDPTADSITWVSTVTYAGASDRCWWGYYSHTMRRHVVAGIINAVAEIYAFKDSDSEPLTSSTVQPVVWNDTKSLLGDIATVTLTNTAPGVVVNDGVGTQIGVPGSTSPQEPGTWASATNAIGSDDTYTTWIAAGGDNTNAYPFQTSYLVGTGFNISSMPRGSYLQGISFTVEAKISSATILTSVVCHAQLLVDGSTVGIPREATISSTSDTTLTFGSASDLWGLGDTTNFTAIGVRVWFNGIHSSSSSTGTISVDAIIMTNFKYQFPGYKTHVNEGSHGCGELPTTPDTFIALEPEVDDATGMVVPRKAVAYLFALDGGSDRVVLATRSYLDAQANYVGDVYPFQGYVAVAVGASSSLWDHVKQITSGGVTTDLNYPAINGADPQHVTALAARGDFLLEDACDTDNTDAQLFGFSAKLAKQYAIGAAQSLSTAPASRPLYWAEWQGRIDEQQQYHYRFYPDGTSHLAVAYEFCPSNLYDDPFLFNTSMTKTDGAPIMTLLELNKGAPESYKADVVAQLQTHYCDDKTLYGTVTLKGSSSGDTTLASPELAAVTFGSTTLPFTDKNLVVATNRPGIPHKTMIYQLSGDHTNGSAKTPNLLPMLILMAGKFPQQRVFTFYLSNEDWHRYSEFLDTIKTMESTDSVTQYVSIEEVPDEKDAGEGTHQLIWSGVGLFEQPNPQQRTFQVSGKPGGLS